ncbi:MAG: metallo-mystery pair system four-Cys motif protein [Deinococcales bacterium]
MKAHRILSTIISLSFLFSFQSSFAQDHSHNDSHHDSDMPQVQANYLAVGFYQLELNPMLNLDGHFKLGFRLLSDHEMSGEMSDEMPDMNHDDMSHDAMSDETMEHETMEHETEHETEHEDMDHSTVHMGEDSLVIQVISPSGESLDLESLGSQFSLDLGQIEVGHYLLSIAMGDITNHSAISVYQGKTEVETEVYAILAPSPSLDGQGLAELFVYAFADGDNVHKPYQVKHYMEGMVHASDEEILELTHEHFDDFRTEDFKPAGNRAPLSLPMVGTWKLDVSIIASAIEDISFDVQMFKHSSMPTTSMSTTSMSTTSMSTTSMSTTLMPITLDFAAMVGEQAALCDQMYEGVGAAATKVEFQDLRFYVSNLRLINHDGEEVAVVLEQDNKWQYQDVALLDFEDGSGKCAQGGNAALNHQIKGSVPTGDYQGLSFSLGVPFALNHADVTTAPAPLNISSMWWSWQGGYKHMRIDVFSESSMSMMANNTTDANQQSQTKSTGGHGAASNGLWPIHIGSTGCISDASTLAPLSECSNPNVVAVNLPEFQLGDLIVADISQLLAGVDVGQSLELMPPAA